MFRNGVRAEPFADSPTAGEAAQETRYAPLSRRKALAVLAALVAAAGGLLWIAAAATSTNLSGDESPGDLATYQRIVHDVRAGTPYYEATHKALVEGGYGVGSVFNWRTPLQPHLIAWAPSDAAAQAGGAAIAALAACAALVLLGRTRRTSGRWVGAAAIALSSVTAAIPGPMFFAEFLGGLLILLSVSLYGLGHRASGLATGLLALFVRELCGVYVVVALALAVRNRRWREVAWWCGGLVAYAGYFLWHREQVLSHTLPGDPAYSAGWLQFGGPSFVLRTAQMDGVLMALPIAITAILLPLALLGLVGSKSSDSLRPALTVGGYLLLFLVVGKSFNSYWGMLYTPLLALGLAAVPQALGDLLHRVRKRGTRLPT